MGWLGNDLDIDLAVQFWTYPETTHVIIVEFTKQRELRPHVLANQNSPDLCTNPFAT